MGYDRPSDEQRAVNKVDKYFILLLTGAGSSSTLVMVLWLHFNSVHFLCQKYELMSPDDLRVIECVGNWGWD